MKFNITLKYLNNNTTMKKKIADVIKVECVSEDFDGENIDVVRIYTDQYILYTYTAASVLNIKMDI